MRREQFTEKLVRMIQTIRSGALPAPVREFYVFGSYSRGALEPGDLDVVVVHDDPGPAYWQALKTQIEEKSSSGIDAIFQAARQFESAMRRALRKPGERVQIILTRQLDHILGASSKIKREDLVLLWSEADHDYHPKLEAICPDSAAGRAYRDHIIDLKRLHDNITIRSVRYWADGKRLSYWLLPGQALPASVPPEAVPPDLEEWLAPLREKYPPATPLDEL